MGMYLVLKDVVKDSTVLVLSRNNDITQAITEEYNIPFMDYARFDDINRSIETTNREINLVEERINAMLIKRDFDIFEFIESKEYLRELYDTRGALRLINSILDENKDIQMNYS